MTRLLGRYPLEMGDKEQEPTEFERFEDLTRNLLKVPKAELQQKLDEHRARPILHESESEDSNTRTRP
jgi:hypothetical protein